MQLATPSNLQTVHARHGDWLNQPAGWSGSKMLRFRMGWIFFQQSMRAGTRNVVMVLNVSVSTGFCKGLLSWSRLNLEGLEKWNVSVSSRSWRYNVPVSGIGAIGPRDLTSHDHVSNIVETWHALLSLLGHDFIVRTTYFSFTNCCRS